MSILKPERKSLKNQDFHNASNERSLESPLFCHFSTGIFQSAHFSNRECVKAVAVPCQHFLAGIFPKYFYHSNAPLLPIAPC